MHAIIINALYTIILIDIFKGIFVLNLILNEEALIIAFIVLKFFNSFAEYFFKNSI